MRPRTVIAVLSFRFHGEDWPVKSFSQRKSRCHGKVSFGKESVKQEKSVSCEKPGRRDWDVVHIITRSRSLRRPRPFASPRPPVGSPRPIGG